MLGSKIEAENQSKLFPEFKHAVHRNSGATEFIFSTAVFLLILCPREYASWSCAFSFAE